MLASENDWDMDVGHSWIAALATQDGHTRGSEGDLPHDGNCPVQECYCVSPRDRVKTVMSSSWPKSFAVSAISRAGSKVNSDKRSKP